MSIINQNYLSLLLSPAMQETEVRFLGPEGPLRRKWQPYNILAWKNPKDRAA